MGDHLAISGGLLQAPLNPLKTDVSWGPPGLSGGLGPLGPHRNSTADCGQLLEHDICLVVLFMCHCYCLYYCIFERNK